MSRPITLARVARWLPGPVSAELSQLVDRLAATEDVRHVAIMPDAHPAGTVCVGAAIATGRLLYPEAVGGDIGCGMAAVRLDAGPEFLDDATAASRLLAGLARAIPALVHGPGTRPDRLPDDLEGRPLSASSLESLKHRDGRFQLGTLGRGNHFVEIQVDPEDRCWVLVHSGSRGMGRAIATHHLNRALATPTGLLALDSDSEAGRSYLADVGWAREYAAANRLAMLDAVATVVGELFGVGRDPGTTIHCDHNHVRRESHFGEEVWVHRKGAMPADLGEPGVIPGSMATPSYHVEGRGEPDSLRSSSHGAGRSQSRAEAQAAISVGQLRRELRGVWYDLRRAARIREEAPSAYKDVRAVIRAQRKLTRIVRELRPALSYRGG